MNILFVKRLYSKWSNWAVVVAILICFLKQLSLPSAISNPAVISRYSEFMAMGYLSLLLPAAYCFWIFNDCNLFNDIKFILRIPSRFKLMISYISCSLINAFAFVLIINIIILSIAVIKNGSILSYFLYLFFSILLQFLFFCICSLLFFSAYLLANKVYVSFIVVILYGVWDYVGSHIPVEWFYIGSGRTIIDYSIFSTNPALVFSNISFLLSIIIVLCVLCTYLFYKRNFIGENEGKSYE